MYGFNNDSYGKNSSPSHSLNQRFRQEFRISMLKSLFPKRLFMQSIRREMRIFPFFFPAVILSLLSLPFPFHFREWRHHHHRPQGRKKPPEKRWRHILESKSVLSLSSQICPNKKRCAKRWSEMQWNMHGGREWSQEELVMAENTRFQFSWFT